MVHGGLIPGGTNKRATLGKLAFDLIGTDIATVVIRVSTELDSDDVACCVRVREEW